MDDSTSNKDDMFLAHDESISSTKKDKDELVDVDAPSKKDE